MSRRVLLLSLLLVTLGSISAAPPAWWASRGATNANPPNDHAGVNQGQLKQFTRKAVDELNATIPGGAGPELDNLIATWVAGHPDPKDTQAMAIGQLKWIASKIHDRLVFAKYSSSLPAWLTQVPATDKQAANLGQLKTVFNFDLSAPPGELPVWWRKFHFNGQTTIDPSYDADGDGLTNLQEYQARTKPNYYDTDGDQFSDGFELGRPGYDPLVANFDGDADGDDLSDLDEITYGTNAGSADSDLDGFTDAYEISHGSTPLDAQRTPFAPSAHFGPALTNPSVQPMGDLGVGNYGNGEQFKVNFVMTDHTTDGAAGGFLTNQEAWNLRIGDDMSVTTLPFRAANPGGGLYPSYSNRQKLQLDGRKTYKVTLQHLGFAGAVTQASSGFPGGGAVGSQGQPDFRHTWQITSKDFMVLTNNSPNVPIIVSAGEFFALGRRSVSSSNPAASTVFPAGYDWTTRENYLIPIVNLGYSASYTGSDATGPRFRKISHFGRPIPDTKPESDAEIDEAAEESYVDAFDLSLHHDTSFASIPLAASDLRLEANASVRETTWSSRSGLRPAEEITSPFGISWSSNLCSYIEMVETLGSSTTRPTSVNVIDEGGRGQRFGTSDMATFVPWPSSLTDKKTYLNELTKVGDDLVLKKKFGNKLTYRPCDAWFMYSSDRLENSPTVVRHRYWRLEEVEDRFGNKVAYDYGTNPYSLIPAEIRAVGRPNQRLTIGRSPNGRRITSITDAESNVTNFHYADRTATIASTTFAYPYQELDWVEFPGGAKENYTYEVLVDPEPETIGTKVTRHLHANLKSIQRDGYAQRVFTYEFDRTKKWYDHSLGRIALSASLSSIPSDVAGRAKAYVDTINKVPQAGASLRVQYGVPRMISKIAWPSMAIESTFAKTAATQTTYGPSFSSTNGTDVTDATGKKYSYTFDGTQGEIIDTDSSQVGGSSSVSTQWLVYHSNTTLQYKGAAGSVLGSETFEFDPDSGLSLKRTVDFSGKETVWNFDESRPVGPRIALANNPGFFSKWADPTKKTDALNRIENYEYGNHRILRKLTDVHGTVTQYTVDAMGRRTVMTVTGSGGNLLQKETYDYTNAQFPGFMTKKTRMAFSNLSGQTWEQDLVVEYIPDACGRIWKEIVDPGGKNLTTIHTYDGNNQCLGTQDPNGNATSFQYDARLRLIKVTYPDASFKTLTYDANSAKTKEVDENGNATDYARDGQGRILTITRSAGEIVTTRTYNHVGLVTKEVDPRGSTTDTTYDDLYRPSVIVKGGGDASITETITYDTNSGGGILAPVKPLSVSRPGLSQSYVYDPLYRTTSLTLSYGGPSPAVTQYSYNGLVTTTTDPLGKITVSTADGLGRTVHLTHGTKSSETFFSSTGLPFLTVDPMGRESRMVYDGAGRETKVLAADPVSGLATGTGSPVSETLYDGNGNIIARIDPLGRRTDFEFDSRNRNWRTQAPAVSSLDPSGNGRPTTTTVYDVVGNVISVTDPRGLVTGTLYDTTNRPYQTTQDAGGLAITTHRVLDPGGLILTSVDGNGNSTENTYDSLGRMLTTTTHPGGGNIVVANEYDARGNLTSVTDGEGRTTEFTYDGMNRKISTIWDPGTAAQRVETSEYNAVHQTKAVDAMGRTTTYGYDADHRLTSITYGGGAAGAASQNRIYTYDAADRILSVSHPNAGDTLRDTAFTYDLLDRLTSETSAGVTHTYPEYDKVGNRKQTVYGGSGTTLSSTYDALNRLVTCTEGTRTTSYGYDLGGKVTIKTLPNGAATATSFDKLGRTLGITERDSSSAVVSAFDYAQPGSYDAVGNVLRGSETYSRAGMVNRVVTNTYDNCHRLLTETITPAGGAAAVTTYGYDKANNRTTKTFGTATTVCVFGDGTNGANSNQLISYGPSGQSATHSFSYDANGNRATRVTAAGTETLTWDHDDRLVSLATSSGPTHSYGYDYRTRRVIRDESAAGGVKAVLSFSGGTSVQEANASGVVQAEFIRGSDWGGGVGGVLYSVRGGNCSFNAYNSRGDVVSTTDATGAATWQAAYEAFGTRTTEGGSNTERQRANTKDEDPTGLLNEGMRYRDLEAGVFISRDPAGFVDGPNVYTYVRQNPWTYYDPYGLNLAGWMADTLGPAPKAIDDLVAFDDQFKIGNRSAGAAKMIGGALEAGVGVAAVPVSGIGGGILALHGTDVASSGWAEMWSGESERTFTSKGVSGSLQKIAGVDTDTANQVGENFDSALSLGGTLGASAGLQATRMATPLEQSSRMVQAENAAKSGVNIDTGTAVAFTSEGSAVRHQLKSFVAGKEMHMTETALAEFQGTLRSAGPLEAARGQRFLNRVSIIPDTPSSRAMGLNITRKVGANDRIIFGTGDQLGIPTMTSDAKFLSGASAQGVEFDAFLHSPVPFTGH